MASDKSYHSKMFFLCPMCKKSPHSLPGHLRKFCMKGKTEEEIQSVVIEAKKELSEFSQKGRFWDFNVVYGILNSVDPVRGFVEEMQVKGLVIQNLPAVYTNLYQPTRSNAAEHSEGPPKPSIPAHPCDDSSDDSSDEYQITSAVRVEMVKKGLYNKHSIDHPLFAGFNKYLRNRNSKKDVEAVSRFMYFIDPTEPTLKFVGQVEKVREYFNVLSDTKLCKQTVLNYWKSLNRFMKYIITGKDARIMDEALLQACKNFMDPLQEIHSDIIEKVNKEVTQKRHKSNGKNHLPKDCPTVPSRRRSKRRSVVSQ